MLIKNIFKTSFLSLSLLVSACEQVVKIDVPLSEPKLVVNALALENRDTFEVWVGHTVGILDTTELDSFNNGWGHDSYANSKWVDNARVELYKNGNLEAALVKDPMTRTYKAALPNGLTMGATYKILVNAPNYKQVSAEQFVPKPLTLQNLNYTAQSARDRDGNTVDELKFDIQDDASQSNYYRFGVRISQRDTSFGQEPPRWEYISSPDPLFSQYGISDETFSGTTKRFTLQSYGLDTFSYQVELYAWSVNKTDYQYYKSLSAYYESQGNPFAEPVVLFSNIENGRGLFSISREQRYRIGQ